MSNYEDLTAMYPSVYYRVYPLVQRACEMYDVPHNPHMYPYPTREAIEEMTGRIYEQMGEIEETRENDWEDDRDVDQVFPFGGAPRRFFPFRRRRFPFLGSLIGVLLIQELLRRRGRFPW